jgi:DNA-binding PadR family transcriptional regulator
MAINSTAASLLGFLHYGPRTGWDLAELVERTIGNFWNVTRSQVYRELRTLTELGLVEPGTTGPRARRPFTVTPAGRREFSRWISQPPGVELIRFPLLLTLFFGDHLTDEQLTSFVQAHRPRHEERLEYYLTLIEGEETGSFRAHTLRFGIEYEQAVLRWFDSLPWGVRRVP